MTKEELLKKIDFEKSWLYDCGIFGSDVDIAFHAIKKSVIEAFEQEPCEDCISRQAAKRALEDRFIELQKRHDDKRYETNYCLNTILELPPVNPQEPKTRYCKDCKWWKDSDGAFRRGIGAESICRINTDIVYQGEGYCYLFDPQESEGKE